MNRFIAKHHLKHALLIVMCLIFFTSPLSPVAQGAPAGQAALFSDNFDDGNANGWTQTAGTWSVVQDSGSGVYSMTALGTEGRTMAGSQAWTNYSVEARVKVVNFGGSNRVMVAGRLLDFNNYYAASLLNSGGGTLEIRRKIGGSSTTLVSTAFPLTTGTWYTVRLEMNGSTLRMFVDGTLRLTATDTSRTSGAIGLIPFRPTAMFDNVVVSPIGAVATPTNTQPGPTSTPTQPATSTTLQAEAASFGGGAVAESNNAGFNGTGFINFPATGGFLQFNNVNSSGGNTTLQFRYALGAAGSRTGSLIVNGGAAQNITFNSTGAWTAWATQNVVVSLNAGSGNTVRLQSTGQDLANIDQLTVSGGGTGPTPTRTNTPIGPTNTPTRTATSGPVNTGLVGYATVNGNTTGGQGGTTVTVNSLSALQSAASSSGAMIIQVNGTINGSGAVVDVASNKTIIGVGTAGRLNGIGINIDDGVSNIIIRNLTIVPPEAPTDAIHLQGPGVNHVWIDHNDLSTNTNNDQDFFDGLLDMSHDVDFVTVSWNIFHDHWKTSLIGHSDDNAGEDTGKFHTTYHHNWFRNVASRGPSNRFGTLHSFNNLFENFFDASSAISSRMGACSRVENNVFINVDNPVFTTQSGTGSEAGAVQLIGNDFGGGTVETSPTCTLNLPYSFSAEGIGSVPGTVRNGAGVGRIN